MNLITNFSDGDNKDKVFNKRIRDCICDLSKRLEKSNDAKEFRDLVVDFYKHFGVGIIGLHKAFRLNDDGDIIPITRITHVSLDDLVGYQIQKDKLTQNTNAFVSGKKANNCLLYGDAGTGKSTSIKALANTYYDDGLRIIEVYKHQFQDLNKLISNITWTTTTTSPGVSLDDDQWQETIDCTAGGSDYYDEYTKTWTNVPKTYGNTVKYRIKRI